MGRVGSCETIRWPPRRATAWSIACSVPSRAKWRVSAIEERHNKDGPRGNRRFTDRDRRAGGIHDKGEQLRFGRLSHVQSYTRASLITMGGAG